MLGKVLYKNDAVPPAVNSVCWGPCDFGLILACGSSDGAISLLTFSGDGQWDVKKIPNAHTVSSPLSRPSLILSQYSSTLLGLPFAFIHLPEFRSLLNPLFAFYFFLFFNADKPESKSLYYLVTRGGINVL